MVFTMKNEYPTIFMFILIISTSKYVDICNFEKIWDKFFSKLHQTFWPLFDTPAPFDKVLRAFLFYF